MSLNSLLASVIHRHRNAVYSVAGCLGAVVLVGGAWLAYDLLRRPPLPNLDLPQTQQVQLADEVARFMADARGWRRLSDPERKRFMHKVLHTIAAHPEGRRALASEFRRLAPREKETIRQTLIETAKRDLLEQSREFNRTSPHRRGARRRMVDRMIAGGEATRQLMRGHGGESDLGEALSEGTPRDTEGWVRYLTNHTSGTDRQQIEPLVNAVQDRIRQISEDPAERARIDQMVRQVLDEFDHSGGTI